MNTKHKVVQKWGLLAAGMVAVMLTVAPWQVLAKSDGKSDGKSNDPCEHLRDPHGKALKIKKGCAVGSSSGVARADFNHDGYGDLAVGAPYENVGSAENAGAVYVIYGSPSGLFAPASSGGLTPVAQRWTQSSSGVPGDPGKDDNFGMALAAGDFDNDGISDLAIGAPGESVSTVANGTPLTTGSVTILYGRLQEGLAASIAPSPITLPALGNPLGNNLCGFDVIVLDGDCSGRFPTYESASEDVARFGSSLTWGDFDGDGLNDLAVGAPNAAVNNTVAGLTYSTKYAGIVVILFGNSHPMATDLNVSSILHQFIPFYPGPAGDSYAEPYDEFGTTLAAGKFNGTRTDLVVGVPYEDIGSVAGGGMVHVFNNCGSSVDPVFCDRMLTQDTSGVPGTPEASDLFGFSLATGDFNGDDGKEELVVGVPYENIGSLVDAGAVQVFHGASTGVSFSNSELWTQSDIFGSSPNDFDGSPSEEDDLFGYSLATADFNGDGKQDLAIGVPYEDVVTTRDGTHLLNLDDAGEVDVLYGSDIGLSKTEERTPMMWHQDRPNVEGQVEEGDHFGFTLSAWNFSGPDLVPDLAIGVPLEDVSGIGNCGAVAVLYSTAQNHGLSSLGDQLWHPDVANVPGSCQTNGKFGAAMY